MYSLNKPLILKLDISGIPQEWITYERAAYCYSKELVVWSMGKGGFRLHGGVSRKTGEQSILDIDPIIAIRRKSTKTKHLLMVAEPSNRILFRRDRQLCAYCGNKHTMDTLTRDHIKPQCEGGDGSWMNLVTCCRTCNFNKGGRTPEKAGMQLLYVPYKPVKAEFLILSNRRILADQMDFLLTNIPKHSRVWLDE